MSVKMSTFQLVLTLKNEIERNLKVPLNYVKKIIL